MKIRYRRVKLSSANKVRLKLVNSIIEEYQAQGYVLTLRQLYYQLVSRDVIPNKQNEYAKLSILLREGRMGGIVDWNAIEDRVRVPDIPSSWNDPTEIIKSAEQSYQVPRMSGQKSYIEVLVEKDALSGVLKRVTRPYHIPITVNRGYSSVSAMHDLFKRMSLKIYDSDSAAENIKLLYIGDFDPSGLDMIRDIRDRLYTFMNGIAAPDIFSIEVIPIALTKKQIDYYDPPPNPAKVTDPRAKDFVARYGKSSWEVDALKPEVLHKLLDDAIQSNINVKQFNKMKAKEKKDKQFLRYIHKLITDEDDVFEDFL